MNVITKKLDQLEELLQSLIEGRIAGLLPQQLPKDDLIQHIFSAMQAGALLRDDGSLLAPDIFHIQVNPQHSKGLGEQDPFLIELAEMVHRAGSQSGFQFLQTPTINLLPDNEMEINNVSVLARLSQEYPGETLALEIETDTKNTSIPPATFLIVDGQDVFPLETTLINIGRRTTNDLVINDSRVSRQHAQLRASAGRYLIFDLDSTGGTFVNGRRISQSALYPRDVISLAGVPLVYAQDAAVNLDETQQYDPASPAYQDDQPTKGASL